MALYQAAASWSSAAEICKIPRTEIRDGVTVYVIEVNIFPFTWYVQHRYSDFRELNEMLIVSCKVDKNLLPPKKFFGSQSESFVSKRQADLELYLQTLIHQFSDLPSSLRLFLDFHLYEIRTMIENLAERLFYQGDSILSQKQHFQLTPLELHAISERLKLAEPTCTAGNTKRDLGHLLSFISQLQHLRIYGSHEVVGTSNIIPNNLSFCVTPFKSLESLQIYHCQLQDRLRSAEPLHKSLKHLAVHDSLKDVSSLILCGNIHWSFQDAASNWPCWNFVTVLNLSHNFLSSIDTSLKLLPAVEHIDLSHNNIREIENLESLPRLAVLNLSYNRIQHVTALHTRLGNINKLSLDGNTIECLQGLSHVFSVVELQLTDNCITSLSEIMYLGKLPDLEKLSLANNPISSAVDYRVRVLLAFGSRSSEITLDGTATTEKEVDTVAVLHALQVAKQEQLTQSSHQKMCSAEKPKTICHHSSTG